MAKPRPHEICEVAAIPRISSVSNPERINARSTIFPLITPTLKKATAVAVALAINRGSASIMGTSKWRQRDQCYIHKGEKARQRRSDRARPVQLQPSSSVSIVPTQSWIACDHVHNALENFTGESLAGEELANLFALPAGIVSMCLRSVWRALSTSSRSLLVPR
jgi:hypothetical protein